MILAYPSRWPIPKSYVSVTWAQNPLLPVVHYDSSFPCERFSLALWLRFDLCLFRLAVGEVNLDRSISERGYFDLDLRVLALPPRASTMPSVIGGRLPRRAAMIPSITSFDGASCSHRLKQLEKWSRRGNLTQ